MPQNYGIPSLTDIAFQSGRIVRFSGACRVHWTVLHHLFVCRTLVDVLYEAAQGPCPVCEQAEGCTCRGRLTLCCMLHDAEEVATGDIPSLWKTAEQRAQVKPLQGRVFQAYVGQVPSSDESKFIKAVDRLALVAECVVVGPPGVLEHSGLASWADTMGDKHLLDAAQHIVRAARSTAPEERDTMRGADSSLVRWFLREMHVGGAQNPFAERLLWP